MIHTFRIDSKPEMNEHKLELIIEIDGTAFISCKTHDKVICRFDNEDLIIYSCSCLFNDTKEIDYEITETDC